MLVVCEWCIGDGDRLLHSDLSSPDPSRTSISSWLALLNHGLQRAQRPLSAAGSLFGILLPTDFNLLEPPRAPSYIIVDRPPASVVLPLIYTGVSLDWRLGRWSIGYNINSIIFPIPGIWGSSSLSKWKKTQRAHNSWIGCWTYLLIYRSPVH